MPTSITGSGLINGLALPTDSIKPGMVHLHTETFSGVLSVSIDNVFNSTYDNYRIVIRHTGGNEDVYMRMRSSGTDATTNYNRQVLDVDGTSVSAFRNTTAGFMVGVNTNAGVSDMIISGPNLVAITACTSVNAMSLSSARLRVSGSTHSTSSSYDGLTLVPGGAGTISGTVSVFGCRNT